MLKNQETIIKLLNEQRLKNAFESFGDEEHDQTTPESLDKQVSESDLTKIVTSYLVNLGVPSHIQGFNYSRIAIVKSIKNPEILSSITKRLNSLAIFIIESISAGCPYR